MKMTLAQLKREADIWEWSLLENSWYKSVPEFQRAWRKVGSKNTVGFTLLTLKDGKINESSIDWPKASEIEITYSDNHDGWLVQINRVCKGAWGEPDKIHTMIYQLRPNLDSIGIAV